MSDDDMVLVLPPRKWTVVLLVHYYVLAEDGGDGEDDHLFYTTTHHNVAASPAHASDLAMHTEAECCKEHDYRLDHIYTAAVFEGHHELEFTSSMAEVDGDDGDDGEEALLGLDA